MSIIRTIIQERCHSQKDTFFALPVIEKVKAVEGSNQFRDEIVMSRHSEIKNEHRLIVVYDEESATRQKDSSSILDITAIIELRYSRH